MKNLSNEKVIYEFKNEMDSVIKVSPKDKIKVQTNDCFFQQIKDEGQVLEKLDYSKLNPATGPIFIEGAETGDILKVKILDINVESKGVSATVPNEGVLGDQVTKSKIKIIDIEDGFAKFNDIKVKIEPMIGVIGVAPSKEDDNWPTETPWKHGGNMDTTDIKKGSTLYFPVNQKGGLLALGDCHAVMGDGEVCFTGLEIPADVTLEVDVIKDKKIKWPLVETKDSTMIIASGKDTDEAIYNATNEAVHFLKNGLNYDFEDAYILASLAVDLKISQVVDPKKTIRAAIPKDIISTEKIIDSL